MRSTILKSKLFTVRGIAVIAIVTSVSCIAAISNSVHAQDWSQIRRKVQHSILYIETQQQNRDGTNKVTLSSSGFVIAKNGYGLTVAHAVPRATSDTLVKYFASVGSRYSNKFPVEVVRRDEELDVALLQFPNIQDWFPVEMGESKEVPDDARLYVLGFPRSSDLSSAEGLLSNHFGPGGKWQTTLPLDYGNSGGPVFDIGGRVIGVAAGGLDDARAITFVIPSNYTKPLQEIVEAEPPSAFAAEGNTTNPRSLSGEIAKAFAFSFTVDHQERKDVQEDFCLPDGLKVAVYQPVVTSKAGNDTKVISVSKVPDKPNCVRLRGTVAGNGVDKFGSIIVNYRGRGWLTGHIDLSGVQ